MEHGPSPVEVRSPLLMLRMRTSKVVPGIVMGGFQSVATSRSDGASALNRPLLVSTYGSSRFRLVPSYRQLFKRF